MHDGNQRLIQFPLLDTLHQNKPSEQTKLFHGFLYGFKGSPWF